jgi:hypothetical protein
MTSQTCFVTHVNELQAWGDVCPFKLSEPSRQGGVGFLVMYDATTCCIRLNSVTVSKHIPAAAVSLSLQYAVLCHRPASAHDHHHTVVAMC